MHCSKGYAVVLEDDIAYVENTAYWFSNLSEMVFRLDWEEITFFSNSNDLKWLAASIE